MMKRTAVFQLDFALRMFLQSRQITASHSGHAKNVLCPFHNFFTYVAALVFLRCGHGGEWKIQPQWRHPGPADAGVRQGEP